MPTSAGRPSMLTPERREQLLTAFRHGATISMACRKTTTNPRTFRHWRRQDKELAEAVEAVKIEYNQQLEWALGVQLARSQGARDSHNES